MESTQVSEPVFEPVSESAPPVEDWLASAWSEAPLEPVWVLATATVIGLVLVFGIVLPLLTSPRSDYPTSLRRFSRPVYWLADNAKLTIVVVFLLAFACGLANGLVRYPAPSVNDEFGYLLGADTLASGRLANAPHPLWRHFETIGVSHQPAFVSKYPIAGSGFMALGQWLFGHPWWGQLIAYSLAAAAVAWMLRAWVGPRWALVGGVLAALHPTMQHFHGYDFGWANYSWSHSYWGGAAAMLGGALVFGGMRHFAREPRTRYAVALSIGLILLANTRPFEGFLVAIGVLGLLLTRAVRGRPDWRVFFKRFALPVTALAIPAIAFLMVYNSASTGSPLRLAHQHYGDQYGIAAEFLFQSPRKPPDTYNNFEMERHYRDWVRPTFEARRSSLAAYLESRAKGFHKLGWFFFSTTFPVLIVIPWLFRKRWWRFAAFMCALAIVQLLVTFDFHPHYAAPFAPLLFAVITVGLARLAAVHGKWAMPARLTLVLVILCTTGMRLFSMPPSQQEERLRAGDWPRLRDYIVQRMEEKPGKDLVLVTTGVDHPMFQVWLHNRADLENAPVIWARDLGLPLEAHPVLAHYPDRKLWYLVLNSGRLLVPDAKTGSMPTQFALTGQMPKSASATDADLEPSDAAVSGSANALDPALAGARSIRPAS